MAALGGWTSVRHQFSVTHRLTTLPSDGQVRGACALDCPDTCSWIVTVKGGEPVSLRGDPDHPFTRGSLCNKVENYLAYAKSPDRLLYPLGRVGPKGSGEFARISWDEALQRIAAELREVIAKHGAEAIWPFLGSGSKGLLHGAYSAGHRLWNVIGASRHVQTMCTIAGGFGTGYTLGDNRVGMDPETFRFAKLVVLWGAITFEELKARGWMRLKYPDPFVPFATSFPTSSGKMEFVSNRMAEAGLDPIAGYTPACDTSQRDTVLARAYPLALVTPADHYFLNSIFANIPRQRRRAGATTLVIHPDDAAPLNIATGDEVRVGNARGSFVAVADVSNRVRPGVVASTKGRWPGHSKHGTTINATVNERDSDMGGGAVYHDNRVRVEKSW